MKQRADLLGESQRGRSSKRLSNSQDRVATISYGIDSGNEIVVDVHIDDYSQETLEKFSLLFASMSNEDFQVQAMQIMQQAFHNDNKDAEFEFFVRATLVKQKLLGNQTKESKKGEGDPIIEPTDLL